MRKKFRFYSDSYSIDDTPKTNYRNYLRGIDSFTPIEMRFLVRRRN